MLTLEQVASALPPHLKGAATQSIVNQLNAVADNPEVGEEIRNNFLSYTKVLQEGRFKTEDYLYAVRFVTYRLMGYTNKDSYMRAFPDRYAKLVADGRDSKEISAYVSMYAKGKLVNLIMEQSLVPSWVFNQHLHQKALNVLAREMNGAESSIARVNAANALATHTAKPKDAGPLISIDMRETSGMAEMKAAMKQMAEQQLKLIGNGTTAKEIAAQPIIEAVAKREP